MRTEYLEGRVTCMQLLYWALALLQLIETPLCQISQKAPGDLQILSPLCRPTEPWRGEAAPSGRMLDWLFIFQHDSRHGTTARVSAPDGNALRAYGGEDAPVYTALQIAVERISNASSKRFLREAPPSREALMQALHGGDVFEEFARHELPRFVNESCVEPPVIDEADSQAFDPDLIASLAQALGPETVVLEVGVFRGRSTLEFAKRAKYVIAVDTFLGDSYMWTTKRSVYKSRLAPFAGFPLLYYCFLADAISSGLSQKLLPVPQASTQAFRALDALGVVADLVYVDAGHDVLDVLQDLTHFWLLLRCGGLMFGDDYHWPGVRAAVDAFAAQKALSVNIRGKHKTKWVFSLKIC
eukprot:TRINITY_DN112664_c0_g1_i1.p1 TRINITY_DN112664_c0_g1~~TRINITY_DN112664_c0_g1_i1.p1  ORF type:complete len:355 (-),score=82.38 TRINITY_DN112664_c0_g1_i1:517-1581(-)